MSVKSLFQLANGIVLLGLCWTIAACGEEKAPQKNQVMAPVSTPSPSTSATTPESSSSTPHSSSTFKPRLDTASSASRVGLSQSTKPTPAKTPQTTETVKSPSKLPGSVAYITKATAVMYKEPSEKAATVSGTFKVSETIYLLEPKMTDESGKTFDVPQWYKIQRKDGRQGWVKARFVGLPI